MCDCPAEMRARVNAKCSDMCGFSVRGYARGGYVPDNVGIGGEDYIDFYYCLQCGKIDSPDFPVPQSAIDKVFGNEEDE